MVICVGSEWIYVDCHVAVHRSSSCWNEGRCGVWWRAEDGLLYPRDAGSAGHPSHFLSGSTLGVVARGGYCGAASLSVLSGPWI